MAPPTEREFARLLAGVGRERFGRLLAAVWRARGRSARVSTGRVEVTDGPTILVHAPPRGLPAALAARRIAGPAGADGVDAVATTAPRVATRLRERGLSVVGPATLREALLYDVDRTTADTLCRTHLGRPLDAPVTPSAASRARAVVGRIGTPGAVAVALVLVALVATAGAPAGDVPAAAPPAASAPSNDEAAAEPASGDRLAPGLTTSGVDDDTALASAHAESVRDRRYRWRVRYREHDRDDRFFVPAARTTVVRVGENDRIHARVIGWGEPAASPLSDSRRAAYADGEHRYVRRQGPNGTATVTRSALGAVPARRYARQAAQYVRWFVDAGETRVRGSVERDGTTYHRLVGRGEGFTVTDGYSLSALVSSTGFVRSLRVSYVPDEDPGVVVVIEFEYDRLGTATASPPPWYGAGANATSATGTTVTSGAGANATATPAPGSGATTNATAAPTEP
jgi:hypothetical protein